MTSKQFVIRFIVGCLILLGLVGIFNRIVDPFWYYRDIEIDGFNAVKHKFQRFERHVKPALLIREQPEAIILGSSFSEVGFDPTDPFFTGHGRLKSMNFALAGASWERNQCDFEFAVTHAPIKRALVGFHPGDLPLVDCQKDFASIGKISTGELLFSDRSLLASIQTILKQGSELHSHTREGMYFYSRHAAGVDNRFRKYFLTRIKENPQCMEPGDKSHIDSNPDAQRELDLSGLRRMIRTAQKHNIELVLFAYPRHAYNFEMDRQCNGPGWQWHALQKIALLVKAESVGSGPVRAWHFYGYNDITAELVGTSAKYWQDPNHFNFEMGNWMLEDMFGENHIPPKIGHPLVSGATDSIYHEFLAQRDDYMKQHMEIQQDFQKLLPK